MKISKLLFPAKRLPTLDEFIPLYWNIEMGDPDKLEQKRKERLKEAADYFNS